MSREVTMWGLSGTDVGEHYRVGRPEPGRGMDSGENCTKVLERLDYGLVGDFFATMP